MKGFTLLLLIACAVALGACTDHYHRYEVEVTFGNGDTDTLVYERELQRLKR